MHEEKREVNLGFAEVAIPPGSHICQIYSDDDERNDTLLQFLLSGLLARDRTACFSEKIAEDGLAHFLRRHNMNLQTLREQGDLTLGGTNDVYFPQGRFDPQYMLDLLASFHDEALEQGYAGARVIGEMTPQINQVPGGSQLFDYEAGVNRLLHDHPVIAVCQYHADAFDGSTIMDVMRVHPMMLVRGNIIHNPFYAPSQVS